MKYEINFDDAVCAIHFYIITYLIFTGRKLDASSFYFSLIFFFVIIFV